MAESRTPDAFLTLDGFDGRRRGERGSGVFVSMDHASTKR
jgi:hypothetical protein